MAENVIIMNGKKRRQRIDIFSITDTNEILVALVGYDGYPELPGGGVDAGESLINAGMRELAEEAGWLATDPCILELEGDWVFKGKDDGWFNRDNWNEEENIALVCTAIRFEPTKAYGSEGDHFSFVLLPIEELIKTLEVYLTGNCTERRKLNALFRITVLKKLLVNNSASIKNSPIWAKWK